MSTSFYPALVLDLIALLAYQKNENEEVITRLQAKIKAINQSALFEAVLYSLTQVLPVGQQLELASLTPLFHPYPVNSVGEPLKLDPFTELEYATQQNWYKLALLQTQVRRELFAHSPVLVLEILTGEIDGDDHSPAGQMRGVLNYSENQGELTYLEEIELNLSTLEWLGCDWVGAPLARISAVLDQYDSRLVFYLPVSIHPKALN
jgi:hypothetical protein